MINTTGTNIFEYLKQDLQKLLREHTLSILFTKKDGTKRALLCTLQPSALPVADKQEGDELKKQKKQSDESLAVWDLENNAWRSFRLDSLISHSIVK